MNHYKVYNVGHDYYEIYEGEGWWWGSLNGTDIQELLDLIENPHRAVLYVNSTYLALNEFSRKIIMGEEVVLDDTVYQEDKKGKPLKTKEIR